MTESAFDLSTTHVHLGLGARAIPLHGFRWTPDFLANYTADHATDGDEGRLVMIGTGDSSWTTWERHPAGEELVVVLDGHMTLIQELEDGERFVELHAGEAIINPRNVWHTSDIDAPCRTLFVTPGRGTEHRPRSHPRHNQMEEARSSRSWHNQSRPGASDRWSTIQP